MYILVGNSIRVEKNIPKLTLWFCFFTGKNCFLFSPIDGWWYINLNVGEKVLLEISETMAWILKSKIHTTGVCGHILQSSEPQKTFSRTDLYFFLQSTDLSMKNDVGKYEHLHHIVYVCGYFFFCVCKQSYIFQNDFINTTFFYDCTERF